MSNKLHYGKLSRSIQLKDLEKDLQGSQSVFVTSFTNVKTNTMTDLRKKLTKSKARLCVVKNSLGRKALESTSFKSAGSLLNGDCALTLSDGDASQVSKIFVGFAEENPGFKICGAVVSGQLFSTDQVKALATLPSREELIAKIVGTLQSPISGIVTVLSQVTRNLVNVVDRIRESKDKQA